MFWNKKKDHSPVIAKIVMELKANGQDKAALPFMSMQDAADYAKTQEEHPVIGKDEAGGPVVQCHSVIGGGFYNLDFRSRPDGGVYLTASYYYDV